MVEFKSSFGQKADALSSYNMRKSRPALILLSAVVAVCGIIVAVLSIIENDLGGICLGVALFVGGAIFYPVVSALAKSAQKKLNDSMKLMADDTIETYRFFPEGFTEYTVKGDEYEAKVRSRYSCLYSAEETDKYYYLFISKNQMHIVLKSSITEGTLDEMNGYLSSALGSRFKQKKR